MMTNAKEIRSRLKLRPERVCADCSLSMVTLSRFERGAGIPNGRSLVALADYYGVSTDALLGRVPLPPEAPTPSQRGQA